MRPTGERWQLGHRPALDGLRGVAVLLVVVAHCGVPGLRVSGTVGVTAFFTLSGFLITCLLLEERAKTEKADLRAFYRRRAVRLFPALALFLVIESTLAVTVYGNLAPETPGELVGAILYVGNWVQAADPVGNPLRGMAHLWSLAVEEQFYLAWPIIVVLASRGGRRAVLAVALIGATLSGLWRLALWADGASGNRIYNGTDTNALALLLGCALAAWLVGRPSPRAPVGLVPAGVLTLGLGFAACSRNTVMWLLAVPPWSALATALVIGGVAGGRGGWLSWQPLAYVGKRSYALYLWHFPVAGVCSDLGAPLWAQTLATIVGGFAAAEVSWRLVERPAQRFRHRSVRLPQQPPALSSQPAR